MKMVIAYVPPFVQEKVVKALQDIPELPGASFMDIRGFGRGRGKKELEPLATELSTSGTLRKLRVEVMIPDSLEDTVVNAIKESAHTGTRGNGKIYVTSLERALMIRTGEEGDAGL